MNREELEAKFEQWHESESEQPLLDYLGMTSMEYSVWVEFDILPGEQVPLEKFLALRSDAYRWGRDADNHLTENRRYKEAVAEIKALMGASLPEEGWIQSEEVQAILDRNNV